MSSNTDITNQQKLEALLKHKGVGPEASKSLKIEDLRELPSLFKDNEVSLTTKATILVAILTLPPTEVEGTWIADILRTKYPEFLPSELHFMLEESKASRTLEILINKVVALHDLQAEECDEAIDALFHAGEPEYLKGAFLEAQRLKRETYLENTTFFKGFKRFAKSETVQVEKLVDICDSYDGCKRYHNYGVFLAALLASVGVPTVLHGLDVVAPKMGVTHAAILREAGKNAAKSMEDVTADLQTPEIGWGISTNRCTSPNCMP